MFTTENIFKWGCFSFLKPKYSQNMGHPFYYNNDDLQFFVMSRKKSQFYQTHEYKINSSK